MPTIISKSGTEFLHGTVDGKRCYSIMINSKHNIRIAIEGYEENMSPLIQIQILPDWNITEPVMPIGDESYHAETFTIRLSNSLGFVQWRAVCPKGVQAETLTYSSGRLTDSTGKLIYHFKTNPVERN